MAFEDIGNIVWIVVVVLAVFFSLPHKAKMRIGESFLAPYERTPRRKTRAELEDDLHREYGAQPLNAEQAERFARIDAEERASSDANYNEHMRSITAWTMSDTYISAEGHKVDMATNKVVEYNVTTRQ